NRGSLNNKSDELRHSPLEGPYNKKYEPLKAKG
ncbi:hypothetical protein FOPG_20028, partial [Fusarium oxysporum f. sp. conglutinans race 2 54008]